MKRLTVDDGVLLFGLRVTYRPVTIKLFIGRYGWVLFDTNDACLKI